jgi:hypothetical protein
MSWRGRESLPCDVHERGFNSMQMNCRPSLSAATPVVREPQNGSKMMSPVAGVLDEPREQLLWLRVGVVGLVARRVASGGQGDGVRPKRPAVAVDHDGRPVT